MYTIMDTIVSLKKNQVFIPQFYMYWVYKFKYTIYERPFYK